MNSQPQFLPSDELLSILSKTQFENLSTGSVSRLPTLEASSSTPVTTDKTPPKLIRPIFHRVPITSMDVPKLAAFTKPTSSPKLTPLDDAETQNPDVSIDVPSFSKPVFKSTSEDDENCEFLTQLRSKAQILHIPRNDVINKGLLRAIRKFLWTVSPPEDKSSKQSETGVDRQEWVGAAIREKYALYAKLLPVI